VINAGTCVEDSRPWHQWLKAAHHWHIGKHITIDEAVDQWRKHLHACKKWQMTSLWTHNKLKHLFKATTLHNWLYSQPPTPYHVMSCWCCLLKIIKMIIHCYYCSSSSLISVVDHPWPVQRTTAKVM